MKHGDFLSRRAQKSRPQIFRVGLSDPKSVAEDAGLVTTARMSEVEAILREFAKIEFGSISMRQPFTRIGHAG
jgi:hypothetical protein